jgi:hypothetical protein
MQHTFKTQFSPSGPAQVIAKFWELSRNIIKKHTSLGGKFLVKKTS